MQSGAFQAAIPLLEALLDEDPDDADLLNDAALAYAQEDEAKQAEAYFRRALATQPDHEAAFYNLLDLLIEARKDVDAREVFTTHEEQVPDTADKTRYREQLGLTLTMHQGDGAPSQSRDADTLRIAFVCGPDRKFITDIEREIGKRHDVRTAYFDDKVNLQRIQRVMDWADVTWFEWCDKILMHASQKLRKTSSVVCRLHRYEAFTSVPQNVNWSFVDTLIPTTQHIMKVLDERAPNVREQTDIRVISSTVDITRFAFKEREPGFNIAYLGYLHHRKNPSLLLQCMHALTREDDRYHLHIGGYFQQPVWELYFDHMLDRLELRDHVTMNGWVDDVPNWLDTKNYLVLPTIHEGNPYSVLEAAAQGIKPLIHNFPGAEELYPPSWRFDSVPEFVDQIVHQEYESHSYRRYVVEHYSLAQQVERVDTLLQELSTTGVDANDYVQSYYDNWDNRLIADYQRGNPRVLNGIEYVLNQIPHSATRILDIGCGIGWSTWEIKRHFPEAEVVGVDISPQLIETADTLFGTETGLTFDTCDVTEDTPPEGPYDAIVMIDVYEHIPRDSRTVFHQTLSQLLKSDGKLILTCPTPHLQRYLAANAPYKLQPVDEIIRDSDLEALLDDIDGATYDKQTVSIWLEGDYFHATLNRSDSSFPAISKVNLEGDDVRAARLNFAPHLQNRSTLVKPEERPVFVLGNQKSGTTAIASLLADHTESTASLDIQDFELLEHTYPALIQGDITTKAFETLHAPFFSKKVIKECLLTTAFDDLKALHPNAEFVFIVRDPRDNIRSILDRFRIPGDRDNVNWSQISLPPLWAYVFGLKWRPLKGKNYIDMLASRWNEIVNIYLKYQDKFRLVKYENFNNDKATLISDLARTLGLEPKADITDKIDIQFQPAGANRELDWIDFYGSKNLNIINRRCSEYVEALDY